MAKKFDITVIGAGPAGFRAATRCAQKGAAVALVEKHFVGGTCLNYGCIPSKALLASAHALLAAKNAQQIGINIQSASPDWQKIQQHKNAIVTGFRKAMENQLKSKNIEFFPAHAVANSPDEIAVKTDVGKLKFQTDKIIIATGSEPASLPNVEIDKKTTITSTEALSLEKIPESMVIVGGGFIGCEMACAYNAFGSNVTIVEALPRLLPMEDQWVSRIIQREFKKAGIEVLTEQKVTSVQQTDSAAKVTLESGNSVEAQKVLISIGRKPACNTDTLEALGLKTSRSAITVNEKMETSIPGVYAIGDVVGTTYLAHGATTEAEIAAANATGKNKAITDYSLVPRVVYTFPEVASVGKTEDKCKADGLDVSIGRAFFKANGRSASENDTTGEIRAVREKSSDKILGISIVGALATELAALAAAFVGTSEALDRIIFPHPTVSETVEEAVQAAFGPQ